MISPRTVAAALLLVSSAVLAQEPSPYSVNGFASVAWSHNFNDPDSRTNQLRVFDFDDDSFKLDVAELVFQKAVANPGDTGFRLDLTAGASVPRIVAASGLFRDSDTGKAEDFDLQQAFISHICRYGNGVRVDVGKFTSHIGAEVIEGYDGYNDNYSRSIIFGYAEPATHTGIRAAYAFSDRVSGMLMVVNGWDNVKDNNDGKSVGAQLTFLPATGLTVYANYIGGPEQSNSSNLRHLIDLIGVWKLGKTTVMATYDLGTDEDAAGGGEDAEWSGLGGYLRYDLSDTVAVAARAEWFDDDDGARTGTAQSLNELTVTASYRSSASLLWRAEVRHDSSDEDVFEEESGHTDTQTTVAMNVIYSF